MARQLGAQWYLFGAQAVALHGAPRTTKNVDITVLLGGAAPAELLRVAIDLGFKPSHRDAGLFATTRVLPARHLATGIPVDFVLGGPGFEQHFADHAQKMRMGRDEVPVIRLEHLVVLKCLAARPQDLEDVRRRPDLDLSEVRSLLAMLESDLSAPTIAAGLDRLVEEYRLSTNNQPAKTRGRG